MRATLIAPPDGGAGKKWNSEPSRRDARDHGKAASYVRCKQQES